ncbi:MAG: hypothetical protein HUU32_21275 [Calditrichaceae bacterium]|nr:hypothetical protein [Calditrichia bacterium]NUQ43928.1 hypothetical protein [Calditrichaceae bacterium]
MNLTHRNSFITLILLLFSLAALADTLVLKDGRVLQGTFKGGTAESLQFDVNGKIETVALSDITSLTFSPREPKAAAAPQSAAGVAAAGAAAVETSPAETSTGPVTIPAGSKLMLKTKDAVSTASHQQGAKFTAELETPLTVNGKVVAPKGTVVYGTVLESRGGRAVGGIRLVVTFTSLNLDNQMIPIVTDDVGAEAGRGGAAKAVGAGALIGAAAGDAGAGAAVGGAVALLASRGNHIEVPPGTLVEVSLKQPVTIQM